ncbi:MAG: iron ABC transporter permease [Chloroflexota bacterium]|nr:iron ABC transporter permease [Chloroflexota bacterium]
MYHKFIFIVPVISILGLVLIVLSLSNGAVATNFSDSFKYLFSYFIDSSTVDPVKDMVISNIRMPRIILSLLVGSALAVSGASLQGLFKNPMADPGIIGVSSGAAVGAVVIIALGIAGSSIFILPIFSFIGGLLAALIVFLLSKISTNTSGTSFILSGLAVSAFLNSIISLVLVSSKKFGELNAILNWLAGGFQDTRWEHVYMAAPIIIVLMPLFFIFSNRINILSLSDDSAKTLGLNVELNRFIFLVLATLMTSVSVAVCGILAFVGIMIPHITRLIVGPDNRLVIPISALIGAVFLLSGDLIARTILVPSEIRLGIITSFIGAPYFIFLLIKQRNNFIER